MEDDEPLRIALVEGLSVRGFEVEVAGTAPDAARLLDAVQFDAVLTDMELPGGGHSVLQAAQERSPPPPVVVFTGGEEPDGEARARERGAFAYLTKPVTVARLAGVLGEAISTSTGREGL